VGFLHADRVKETSTTTGTGTYTLAGAATGFRTFVAGIGNGNKCIYCVEDGTDWEINEGTVTDAASDTLSRDKLLASSTGSAINWGAGTRRLYCCYAAAERNPKTVKLGADHTLASSTGTEVTGLQFVTLRPGTYVATYYLLTQSSATGTGIGIGLNFTGTATLNILRRYGSTGTTASTGVADDAINALGGQIMEAQAAQAASTTTPNMIYGGVATANTTLLEVVEAVVVVTAVGDLEVWHSSETANNTSVKAGSVGILTRIDD